MEKKYCYDYILVVYYVKIENVFSENPLSPPQLAGNPAEVVELEGKYLNMNLNDA